SVQQVCRGFFIHGQHVQHGLSPGDTAPLHSMHAMPPATAHTNGTPLPQHAHTPQPQVTVLPQPQERRTPWLALAGIAAAFLLIIGMNVVWFSLYRGLQTQQTQITSLIEQQAQVIANMDAVPPAAPIVVAGNTHSISLQPNIPDAEFVNARIVYDAQSNIGSVWADNLPQPTAGHGYQVWLVRGEEVVSLGTFSVTIGGEGSLLFRSPVPITPDDVLGISTEPVSGSQEPTTPHLVTGKIDT
ncbi:MAG: anti-sigma factor, partial [Chloroflexota bacterium]